MKDYKNIQTRDLIILLQGMISNEKEYIKERKDTISSNYMLAKLDFLVIDNMEDTLQILEKVLPMLEDLQDRIITRNKGRKVI